MRHQIRGPIHAPAMAMAMAMAVTAALLTGLAGCTTLGLHERPQPSTAPADRAERNPVQPGVPLVEPCQDSLCQDSLQLKSESRILDQGLWESGVTCDPGWKVTGGGIQTIDDKKLFVWKNRPLDQLNGWAIGVSNYGTDPRRVTVYAVCMRVE